MGSQASEGHRRGKTSDRGLSATCLGLWDYALAVAPRGCQVGLQKDPHVALSLLLSLGASE